MKEKSFLLSVRLRALSLPLSDSRARRTRERARKSLAEWIRDPRVARRSLAYSSKSRLTLPEQKERLRLGFQQSPSSPYEYGFKDFTLLFKNTQKTRVYGKRQK